MAMWVSKTAGTRGGRMEPDALIKDLGALGTKISGDTATEC